MKQFYFTKLSILFLFFTQMSWGQIKLGENPQSIDPTALLELQSTTQGLLLPRMTSAQRDAIPMDTSPVGLVIFNTDTNALQYLFEETTLNAKGEQRQVLRWESATDSAIPFTQPTNPSTGQLYYDLNGGVLHLWDGNQWIPVGGPNAIANSGGATTTVTYQSLSLVGNQLSISNGNSVDLSSLVVSITGPIGPQGPAGNPATDDQSLAASPLSASNTMTLAITGGNTLTLDLSALDNSGTDSQTLTNSALSAGSTMTLAISDGNTVTLDLSALDDSGTDSQTLTNSALSAASTMTLAISDGNAVTLDLSALDQDIAELNFNPTGNILTVGITGGASETTSFATLGSTTVSGSLTVNGPISQTGTGVLHPDYVFESYFDGVSEINKDYRLPSLSEIESFVRENKHLPGVQSRADIQVKGLWDVGENVRTNLEKVEELYLHTIEQQKQIEAQQKEIDELKALLHQLLNHRTEKK